MRGTQPRICVFGVEDPLEEDVSRPARPWVGARCLDRPRRLPSPPLEHLHHLILSFFTRLFRPRTPSPLTAYYPFFLFPFFSFSPLKFYRPLFMSCRALSPLFSASSTCSLAALPRAPLLLPSAPPPFAIPRFFVTPCLSPSVILSTAVALRDLDCKQKKWFDFIYLFFFFLLLLVWTN